jgi:transposase
VTTGSSDQRKTAAGRSRTGASRLTRQLSRKSDTAAAIQNSLNLWTALTNYCGDGRTEIDNSAAERVLRGVPIGFRNYLFAGSDSDGERAAAIYSLIGTV